MIVTPSFTVRNFTINWRFAVYFDASKVIADWRRLWPAPDYSSSRHHNCEEAKRAELYNQNIEFFTSLVEPTNQFGLFFRAGHLTLIVAKKISAECARWSTHSNLLRLLTIYAIYPPRSDRQKNSQGWSLERSSEASWSWIKTIFNYYCAVQLLWRLLLASNKKMLKLWILINWTAMFANFYFQRSWALKKSFSCCKSGMEINFQFTIRAELMLNISGISGLLTFHSLTHAKLSKQFKLNDNFFAQCE